jgi:hypothetical protein
LTKALKIKFAISPLAESVAIRGLRRAGFEEVLK